MISLDSVSYFYAGCEKPAVSAFSCEVPDGTLTLVTGRSGCGKSTLLRLINGLCPHYYGGRVQGKIALDGQDMAGLELSDHAAKTGSLFQDPERGFFALTVEAEIAFALEWHSLSADEIRRRTEEALERFGLNQIRKNSIAALSEGQKQKVALASLFALGVRNLILDEPSANLDPEAADELALTLKELKAAGCAVLIADHRSYWLKDICDEVIVMQGGAEAARGGFAILHDSVLREKYGLRQAAPRDPRAQIPDVCPDDRAAVKGRHISFAYKNSLPLFSDFSFVIPEGLSALMGPNGAGKTTLSRLIFGLEKPAAGEIEFAGTKEKPLKLGSLVLQNADYQLTMPTVGREIETCLRLMGKPSGRERILELLGRFGLEKLYGRHPQSLSGGEKQRLVIACALSKEPRLLILDEPTSGLDGENLERVRSLLRSFARDGRAALVITHDLELLQEPGFKALRLNSL